MQPLRLELNYFGPYQKTIVEFADFYANGLFLITGKTGAGKTSIFDGMSYALYGVTSGDDRAGKDMRSNFATIHDVTSVIFTFKYNKETYVIERKPEQVLAKKRATGVTTQTATVTLTVFDENGVEIEQLIKQTQVRAKIEELLQLNEQQFSQIIMLPQGDFKRFLMSDSNDKEKILRKLFDTHFYQQIAENVLLRKKEQSKDLGRAQEHLELLAEQLVFSESFDQEQREGDTLSDHLNFYALQEKEYLRELAELTTQQQNLEQKWEQAQKEVTRLKNRQGLQEKAALNLERKQQLDNQAQEMTLKQEIVIRLDKLKASLPLHEEVLNLEQELSQLTDEKQQLEKERLLIEQNLAELKMRKDRLQNEQQLVQQSEDVLRQIENVLPLFEEKTELIKQQATVETSLEKVKQDLETQREQVAKNQAEIERLQKLAGQKEEWQEKNYHLQTQMSAIQQLSVEQKEYHTFASKLDQLLSKRQQIKEDSVILSEQVKTSLEAFKQTKNQWAKEQIARLSTSLLSNEPCPLCGALDHPNPAHSQSTLSPEELQQLEVVLEQDEKNYHLAKEHLALKEQEAQYLEQEYQVSSDEKEQRWTLLIQHAQSFFKVGQDTTPDVLIKKTTEQQFQVEKLLTQAETELSACKLASETLEGLKKAQTDLVAQEQILQEEQQELRLKEQQVVTMFENIHKQIPEKWQSIAEVRAEKIQMEAIVLEWKQDFEKTTQQENKAQEQLATVKGRLSALDKQIEQTTSKFAERQDKLLTQLAEQQVTLVEFDAEKTKIAQIEQLKTDYEDYAKAVYATNELTKQLAAELAEQPEGDLALSLEQTEILTTEKTNLQEKIVALKLTVQNNEALVSEIKQKEAKIKTQLEALTELTLLSNVMNGDGQSKLSIERYCLQIYLKKIIAVANQKLLDLSNGRYYLKIRESQGTFKKDTGLEMDIFDGHVGSARGVNTLSGGESFMASLSLALALAEVIQQISGGVRIEAMFIDEGFGSLDEETLEIAMKSLEKIKGDGRLIGLISHVKELQERIPQQLQVMTNQDGTSQVREILEFT